MKSYPQIILSLFLCLFAAHAARAASTLDELYRDIVKSDNEGYLPMYVKNRTIPDLFSEADVLRKQPLPENTQNKTAPTEAVHLTNTRLARDAARKAVQLKWDNTLLAVQQNRVTPIELEEINRRVAALDPKATEVLAWMYTRGVGIQINLIEAFKLYQQAALLQVPSAAENALKVYKSLNTLQREQLKDFRPSLSKTSPMPTDGSD